MKKFFLGFCLLMIAGFLAGCITIPFGDGSSLEISSNGIEVVSEESNEEASSDNNLEEDSVNGTEDKDTNQSEETSGTTKESESGESEESDEANSNAQNGACEAQEYLDITDSIEADIYIPECAILTDIAKNNSYLEAYLTIEMGDWEEVFNEYKDFLGDQITGENKYIANQSGRLEAVLSDEGTMVIRIDTHGDNVVLILTHYFSD